jgi:hypothetical protein
MGNVGGPGVSRTARPQRRTNHHRFERFTGKCRICVIALATHIDEMEGHARVRNR